MTHPSQPANGRRAGRQSQSLQAKAQALHLQQQQAAASAPRRGLTADEVQDLCNALDVLCGCYADGIHSSSVQRLLKDYAPGTKRGTRARRLFNVLPLLIDRIIDATPDCPRWASQAVDRLSTHHDDIDALHQDLDRLEGLQ
jgi:hypothetical protein